MNHIDFSKITDSPNGGIVVALCRVEFEDAPIKVVGEPRSSVYDVRRDVVVCTFPCSRSRFKKAMMRSSLYDRFRRRNLWGRTLRRYKPLTIPPEIADFGRLLPEHQKRVHAAALDFLLRGWSPGEGKVVIYVPEFQKFVGATVLHGNPYATLAEAEASPCCDVPMSSCVRRVKIVDSDDPADEHLRVPDVRVTYTPWRRSHPKRRVR